MLLAGTDARHHRHPTSYQFVSTLPDVRADTVSDADIAAHEAARAEAAKVKKNPWSAVLATQRANLEQINNDMSFGVSYSQSKRNLHAQEICVTVQKAIEGYANDLIGKTESKPDEFLTEQDAHNISAFIFYDVQLEEYMKALGMSTPETLTTAVNRLKSLQKLYLFEQKGGENYLG